MTVQEFVAKATKDRYALIIPESMENYARLHTAEIMRVYRCTGMLVIQSNSGATYHVAPIARVTSIQREGLRPSTSDDSTYGAGVIYTYPRLDCYTGLDSRFGVFRIEYGPGALRAIYTEDKEENEQGEILVFPKCVQSVEYLGTGSEVLRRVSFNGTELKRMYL